MANEIEQLGKFLGGKFNELASAIKSIPQSDTSKLEVILEKKLNEVNSSIKANSPELKIDFGNTGQIVSAIASLGDKAVFDKILIVLNGLQENLNSKNLIIPDTSEKLEAIVSSINALKFPEAKEDTKIHKLLGDVVSAVGKIKFENKEVKIDNSEIVKELKAVKKEIKSKDNSKLEGAIEGLKDSVEAIKLVIPSVFKLEENQLRKLSASSKSMATNGSQQVATRSTMANVAMATANTEYSYTFPSATSQFFMKIRTQNVKILHAWVTGKLPTSGDGLAYMTTPQNSLQGRQGVDYGGKTIYFQTGSATQKMEIESFQL